MHETHKQRTMMANIINQSINQSINQYKLNTAPYDYCIASYFRLFRDIAWQNTSFYKHNDKIDKEIRCSINVLEAQV